MTRGVLDPDDLLLPPRLHRRRARRRGGAWATRRSIESAWPSPAAARAAASPWPWPGLSPALLDDAVKVCLPDVPFLCHYPARDRDHRRAPLPGDRALLQGASRPRSSTVFRTLSYFDGVQLCRARQAEALFSVALMDDICPPSTVFAAYNHYGGPKEIRVWPVQPATKADKAMPVRRAASRSWESRCAGYAYVTRAPPCRREPPTRTRFPLARQLSGNRTPSGGREQPRGLHAAPRDPRLRVAAGTRKCDDIAWFWDAVIADLGIRFATPYTSGVGPARWASSSRAGAWTGK